MKLLSYKVFRLIGQVQHYAWGGYTFLPQLLHIPNPDSKPFAEYWLGAHENASSLLVLSDGQTIKLHEYIRYFPVETLGDFVVKHFGKLPYLLKILEVRDMLSIQVHPTKENAERAFKEESSLGIPLNAVNRNYKDDNHKPELMVALSDFWLLHGFKAREQMKRILRDIPELNFLLPVFENGDYQALYKTVMEMDQVKVNACLHSLLARIIPAYQANRLSKDDESFWAARAALTFNEPDKTDRGIFSVYLFNLLHLAPGEAIFQAAGLPHAYLEGLNVEIMANSDNVLRGGLTSKHIDVKELIRHVRFQATDPEIIHGKAISPNIKLFITPAPDFELGKIELKKNGEILLTCKSATIFFVLEGELLFRENLQPAYQSKRGEAFIGFHNGIVHFTAIEDSILYMASVPVANE